MNQYDISGILATYSMKAKKATSKEQLKEVIKELKQELDLRQITFEE